VRSARFVALAALALLTAPALAETPQERDCKLFIDQVAARLRAGYTEETRSAVPRLRRCQTLLKASLDRKARKIVQDYDTLVARSRRPPPDGD
jgi:hypothetical protein